MLVPAEIIRRLGIAVINYTPLSLSPNIFDIYFSDDGCNRTSVAGSSSERGLSNEQPPSSVFCCRARTQWAMELLRLVFIIVEEVTDTTKTYILYTSISKLQDGCQITDQY